MAKNIGSLMSSARTYQEQSQTSRLTASWSEKTATEYQKITAHLLADVTPLAAKEKAINGNANLSPIGRHDQVKREVQTFTSGLRWLRDEKGTLETKCGNLFGDLFVLPASTRNEMVQAMRDAQIWSLIGALPPTQRDLAYLRFSEADNVEVMRALQDAPMPLVTDDIRLRGSADRAARLDPQRYQAFIESGQLLDEVAAILTDCLNLGAAFGFDVPVSVDELGPKVRTALDFAMDHAPSEGHEGTSVRNPSQEVVEVA